MLADKGGGAQISTTKRVPAEIIASDVALLVTFNHAIDAVIQNNPKARANPKALAQLDGYKRPLVGPLSMNLQRFGMERVAKVESLQKIIAEMSETDAKGSTTPSEKYAKPYCENAIMIAWRESKEDGQPAKLLSGISANR